MVTMNNMYNFLKSYNELSNPVISEIKRQEWSLEINKLPDIEELYSIYNDNNLENEKILEIKKPEIEECPLPNDSFKMWVNNDYKNIKIVEIKYIEKKEDKNSGEDNTEKKYIYFGDNQNREVDFNEWLIKRSEWRKRELQDVRA